MVLLHNVTDITFVGSNAVDYFIVDDESADEFEVVGHLSAGDEVEHGSFAAAGGSEDGCEGVGWETAGAGFQDLFDSLNILLFAINVHLLLNNGVNSDLFKGKFHGRDGVKNYILVLFISELFGSGIVVFISVGMELDFHVIKINLDV